MPDWLGWLIAIVALAVLAPPIAWFAARHGRKARGVLALAAFLGFATVFDTPNKHHIEAQSRGPEEEEAAGDPPEV